MIAMRLTPLLLLLFTPAAMAQGSPPAEQPQQRQSIIERLGQLEQESQSLQRAVNLARNTVVELNGGLRQYQPGLCMVEARRIQECLISRGPSGFVFRFPGGPPGWVAEQKAPTVESEISIAADGRSVLRTLYNGPPRSSPQPESAGAGSCPCVCPPAR